MDRKPFSLDALSKILIEKEAISETNLSLVNQFKDKWAVSIYDAVIETHLLSERDLADLLAEYFRVTRSYAISKVMIQEDAFDKISFLDARERSIFPLGTDLLKNEFKVVIGDPTDKLNMEFLSETLGSFNFFVSEKKLIQDAILKYFPITSQLPSLNNLEDQ